MLRRLYSGFYGVKPRGAGPVVEVLGIEIDVFDVVIESRLADKLIDCGKGARGFSHEGFVSQQEQTPRGLVAKIGLL